MSSKPQAAPARFALSPRGRLVLRAVLLVTGGARLVFSTFALVPPVAYRKDFIQEYLLGRAVLAGVNPYLSLPELVARLLPGESVTVFPHPTPHPPVVALVGLPFALLRYEYAAAAWFCFEAVCLCACVFWLMRWWGRRPSLWAVLGCAVAAFIWDPVLDEFVIGQLNTLLLLLLVGAWLALRRGRSAAGGCLLGAALSLKLIAWPVLIFLALRRDWRAVGAAVGAAVAAHLLAGLAMGFGVVADYYTRVGATVAPLYRAHEANFSAWSVGWRLFEGVSSPIVSSLTAPPLIHSPLAARVVAYALPALVLAVALLLALKAKSFDTSFAILVCASVLVSPIAWSHYLLLTAIAAVVTLRRLVSRGCAVWLRRVAVVVGLLLFVPRLEMMRVVRAFAVNLAAPDGVVTVPFAAGLLTLIPAAATLGLMWLAWKSESVEAAGARE